MQLIQVAVELALNIVRQTLREKLFFLVKWFLCHLHTEKNVSMQFSM